MNTEILVLTLTAASIGFVHTLFGPDHYLPFIVMSKAGKWSTARTAAITALCGIGHVGSSVLIGLIGIAFGIGLSRLQVVEGFRGNIAAWLLIGFGLAYCAWGILQAARNEPHAHIHPHSDHEEHAHDHTHQHEHLHAHAEGERNLTPWVLFTIFIFGPCEPLIPILMYPAAKHSLSGMVSVTLVFALVTIVTMLTIVMVSLWGISFAALDRLDRYTHALAGATILLCGVAIQTLGL